MEAGDRVRVARHDGVAVRFHGETGSVVGPYYSRPFNEHLVEVLIDGERFDGEGDVWSPHGCMIRLPADALEAIQ